MNVYGAIPCIHGNTQRPGKTAQTRALCPCIQERPRPHRRQGGAGGRPGVSHGAQDARLRLYPYARRVGAAAVKPARIIPRPNLARIMAEAFGDTWIEPVAPPPAPDPPPAPLEPVPQPPRRPAAVESRSVSGQCTGADRTGRRCPYEAKERLGPVALCRPHMDELLVKVATDVSPRRSPRRRLAVDAVSTPAVPLMSIVYYIGEPESRLVKIGTTSRPRLRLMELQRRRPSLVLLAHERGGSDVERLRHEQFRDLRAISGAEREWFRRTDELMEHIAAVRSANPRGIERRALRYRFHRARSAGKPGSGASIRPRGGCSGETMHLLQ